MPELVKFKLNDKELTAEKGTLLIEAARSRLRSNAHGRSRQTGLIVS